MRVSFNPTYTCNKKKSQPLNQNPSFGTWASANRLVRGIGIEIKGDQIVPALTTAKNAEKDPMAKEFLEQVIQAFIPELQKLKKS